MNEKKLIPIITDYIKLGQFLKVTGTISSGSDAKFFLIENKILVNGENENRRGKKLYKNYTIEINGTIFVIG
ncbi:MAG: S4 domain-containing protein YaaA [Mycoplasmoidaceae bacterium]